MNVTCMEVYGKKMSIVFDCWCLLQRLRQVAVLTPVM